MTNLSVLKVGGSLFDWPELPARLAETIAARQAVNPDERIAFVAGGGPAADLVRQLDRLHGLGEKTAHCLALHAMDLTANMLAELLPGAVAVHKLENLRAVWSDKLIPVVAPRLILADAERAGETGLPASWDVTSDSIAAWIGLRLAADRLLLLKSAPLPPGTTRLQAAQLGLVDAMFCIVAQPLRRVEYMNLRERSTEPRLLP
jgi:aspartokinase-like uncharacterized kinase